VVLQFDTMNKIEIIRQAKYFFGKNRKPIKELVLSYEFNGKHYKQWKKEFKNIIDKPVDIHFGIFDDIVLWIKENKLEEINWNWIGDLSWTIDILLNEGIKNGLDWDIKLATKCNGTTRFFTIYVSEVIPCYTYDCHYMTYNKKENYYESGPVVDLTNTEKKTIEIVEKYLKNKGLVFLNRKFCEQKFKELISDTNKNGNASLFDVLFKDTNFYQTEIKRTSTKQVAEKSGTTYSWTEFYNLKKNLKERIEYRHFKSGDCIKTVFDIKGQIKNIEVVRKLIGRKKYQKFNLNILETFKQRNKNII
jgi:hypothetical protein